MRHYGDLFEFALEMSHKFVEISVAASKNTDIVIINAIESIYRNFDIEVALMDRLSCRPVIEATDWFASNCEAYLLQPLVILLHSGFLHVEIFVGGCWITVEEDANAGYTLVVECLANIARCFEMPKEALVVYSPTFIFQGKEVIRCVYEDCSTGLISHYVCIIPDRLPRCSRGRSQA